MTQDEFVGQPNGDANHRPLLWLALEHHPRWSGLNVLELGLGYGSTQQLHDYVTCADSIPRLLLSVDHSPEWFSKFSWMQGPSHMLVCGDYDSPGVSQLLLSRWWNVVLIDHAPGERRAGDMLRLINNTGIFVCHDTEDHPGSAYGDVWKHFKYRCDINPSTPEQRKANATAVSNHVDVSTWKGQVIAGYTIS